MRRILLNGYYGMGPETICLDCRECCLPVWYLNYIPAAAMLLISTTVYIEVFNFITIL